ncbi:hypothetical protein IEU95_04995 [Hoyosella rhizosphaerae]|uniref:Type VII secretion-associated protein n=1 Tax=Hoyosella rhizosphaerae TaxID=1755582 RepID=A0A916U9M0_9ACTN|nr:hypothetical protein [Hoyosella rhizosphaerae]MBN4926175.1 hypothetical protein [Hoyosella rhizosphaerae]GGC64938.1 hypothetical protein GCM10011410_16780 [Hoyosella rhizosphaerae]
MDATVVTEPLTETRSVYFGLRDIKWNGGSGIVSVPAGVRDAGGVLVVGESEPSGASSDGSYEPEPLQFLTDSLLALNPSCFPVPEVVDAVVRSAGFSPSLQACDFGVVVYPSHWSDHEKTALRDVVQRYVHSVVMLSTAACLATAWCEKYPTHRYVVVIEVHRVLSVATLLDTSTTPPRVLEKHVGTKVNTLDGIRASDVEAMVDTLRHHTGLTPADAANLRCLLITEREAEVAGQLPPRSPVVHLGESDWARVFRGADLLSRYWSEPAPPVVADSLWEPKNQRKARRPQRAVAIAVVALFGVGGTWAAFELVRFLKSTIEASGTAFDARHVDENHAEPVHPQTGLPQSPRHQEPQPVRVQVSDIAIDLPALWSVGWSDFPVQGADGDFRAEFLPVEPTDLRRILLSRGTLDDEVTAAQMVGELDKVTELDDDLSRVDVALGDEFGAHYRYLEVFVDETAGSTDAQALFVYWFVFLFGNRQVTVGCESTNEEDGAFPACAVVLETVANLPG